MANFGLKNKVKKMMKSMITATLIGIIIMSSPSWAFPPKWWAFPPISEYSNFTREDMFNFAATCATYKTIGRLLESEEDYYRVIKTCAKVFEILDIDSDNLGVQNK